jgi:hypothetical protein
MSEEGFEDDYDDDMFEEDGGPDVKVENNVNVINLPNGNSPKPCNPKLLGNTNGKSSNENKIGVDESDEDDDADVDDESDD